MFFHFIQFNWNKTVIFLAFPNVCFAFVVDVISVHNYCLLQSVLFDTFIVKLFAAIVLKSAINLMKAPSPSDRLESECALVTVESIRSEEHVHITRRLHTTKHNRLCASKPALRVVTIIVGKRSLSTPNLTGQILMHCWDTKLLVFMLLHASWQSSSTPVTSYTQPILSVM